MSRIPGSMSTSGILLSALFLAACSAKTAAPGGTDVGTPAMVALSGDTAVVGVPCDGAHVFVRTGESWTRQAILPASRHASCSFGTSVAISGDTILVGDTSYGGGDGAAYVFVRNDTTWSEQTRLTLQPRSDFELQLGYVVAVSGDTAMVLDSGIYPSAHVFNRIDEDWSADGSLPISTPPQSMFGSSGSIVARAPLSLTGDTAVVHAVNDGYGHGDSDADDLRVYSRLDNGSWTEQATLPLAGAEHVAVSADRIVAAAYDVEVFDRSGATWVNQASLSVTSERLGGPLSLTDDEITVSGSSTTAFTFVRAGDLWNEDETKRRSAGGCLPANEGVVGMSGDRVVQAGIDQGTLVVCDL